MIIFTRKCVFVGVPRCGTTWLHKALTQGSHVERVIEEYDTLESVEHHNLFKAVFIRHPMNWYPSYFQLRNSLNNWGHNWIDQCRADNFDDFIRNCLKSGAPHLTTLYNRVFYNSDVDFIGKTENLANDLIKVLKESGEYYRDRTIRLLKPVRVTSNKPEWDDNLLNQMLELEALAVYRWQSS